MKKIASILFILIATVFCFKDIIAIVASDSSGFVMDINEDDDESDKTEKGDTDEKSDFEKDWQLNQSEQLSVINGTLRTTWQNHKVKKHFTPYFEICSPPPEFI